MLPLDSTPRPQGLWGKGGERDHPPLLLQNPWLTAEVSVEAMCVSGKTSEAETLCWEYLKSSYMAGHSTYKKPGFPVNPLPADLVGSALSTPTAQVGSWPKNSELSPRTSGVLIFVFNSSHRWIWWLTPVISACGRLRAEDDEVQGQFGETPLIE